MQPGTVITTTLSRKTHQPREANDETKPEPRTKDVRDGKQRPETTNRQQQTEAVGEGKEGTQGKKGCCEAARPLAHCDPKDFPIWA
jgi:hypothetical protein